MYDYIIVGAGSSGCALTARLINLCPDAKIALIESGDEYLYPLSRPPTEQGSLPNDEFSTSERFAETWNHPKANRGYRTVPQKALNNRQIAITRASAIGGCSVVNALIWTRGFREDWDEYMPDGFKGKDIESEFEWLEERIKPVRYETNFLGQKAIEAAESLGYKKAKYSLWESPGTSNGTRIAIDGDGRRQDVYRALGANDSRITLLKGSAEKIIFDYSPEGTPYASGVLLKMGNGSSKELFIQNKGGEVILSCGAIDSPKLLQLSGVGPKHLLEDLDIPLVLDSPVGEGLKDHPMLTMAFEASKLPEKWSPNAINASLYDESLDIQFQFLDGKCNTSLIPLSLIEPCREKKATNIIEKLKNAAALSGMTVLAFILSTLAATVPPFRAKLQTSFGVLLSVNKPTSTGSVMIRSKDPTDAPLIDTGLLRDERDMNTMIKAVQKMKELVKTSPLKEVVGAELTPSAESPDEVKELIRKTASVYHHSTGTCSSCLDDKLRFRGIDRLRVADASSLLFHPRVPTNASSMAVGARCASIIASSTG